MRFHAPYVGHGFYGLSIFALGSYSFFAYLYMEVKIYATKFRSSGASGTTRVCSLEVVKHRVEGGAIDDEGFKCDQNLLRFGEGTDEPNQLHVTTKQGKMSSNTRFALKYLVCCCLGK